MLNEEIARLTGRLVFQVDNRPLMAFEKRLTGVLGMLRELQGLANKKFTVKVALDSKSLRAQIDKATKSKITLNNVDISQEALHQQSKRIQDHLNKTTINLSNIRVDLNRLIEQKRFVKTLMGQMQLELPVKLQLSKMEAELRKEVKAIGDRNPIRVNVEISHQALIQKLRRALRQAEAGLRTIKIRVAEPQVRLKVDKQHLIDEIRAAIASQEFRIRVNARGSDLDGAYGGRSGSRTGGRSQIDRGLSSAMGFARGALPGLGAAFALSQMNQINQQVQAATNSLHAVSGDEKTYNSNKIFLENMAREMGLNFRDIAPQFSSIFQAAAPSIGAGGTQDMFRGIMKYGTVHGLDKESMKGSMRALSQMFGKDKIQSEEARQQFAERMPGGMALLAQAAKNAGLSKNGTVAEFEDLMKKGNADPKKILPELAKLMENLADKNDAYRKSLETTRVAQGRMNRAFEESVVVFSAGGFDRGMAKFFNTTADSMERAKPLTESLGAAFEILIKPVNALIRLVGHLGENWGAIADTLGVTKNQLATFAAAVGIFMLPFGGFIVAIGAAALALDDLITYLSGGESVFGDWVKNTEGAQSVMDGLVFAVDGLKTAWADLKEAFGDSDNPFKNWSIDSILLTNLEYIRSLIDSISATMRAITQLKAGNYAEAAKTLGSGIADVATNNPGVRAYKGLAGLWKDGVTGAAEMGQGWLQAYRENQNSKMPLSPLAPQTPSSNQDQKIVPMTFEITVPINVQGMISAADLTSLVAEPMKEAAANVFKDALGQARAQQAERQ